VELLDLLAQRVTFLPELLGFRLGDLHRRLEFVALIPTLANTPDDRRTVFEHRSTRAAAGRAHSLVMAHAP
jgi:hypothetical protein